MEGEVTQSGDGPSDLEGSRRQPAAAAAGVAAAPAADPQAEAEALLHIQHTADEDEIAEVDPQNRYYRCACACICGCQPPQVVDKILLQVWG